MFAELEPNVLMNTIVQSVDVVIGAGTQFQHFVLKLPLFLCCSGALLQNDANPQATLRPLACGCEERRALDLKTLVSSQHRMRSLGFRASLAPVARIPTSQWWVHASELTPEVRFLT